MSRHYKLYNKNKIEIKITKNNNIKNHILYYLKKH